MSDETPVATREVLLFRCAGLDADCPRGTPGDSLPRDDVGRYRPKDRGAAPALTAVGGGIESAEKPPASFPADGDDAPVEREEKPVEHGVKQAPVERDDAASGRRRPGPPRFVPTGDSAGETTSAQAVLLATAGAAFLTVAAVLLLTGWAYATATGSTDLNRRDVDPVFEVRDKLVWIAALVIAGSLGLVLALIKRPVRRLLESWPVLFLTVAGTAGVAYSAAWVDGWIGFGPANLLLAVALVPLLVFAVGPWSRGAVPFLWPAVVALGLVLYLPALWQTPRGMYDPYHAARNIDELLGPVAGSFPLSDYVPQYGGMLGLPLIPFRSLVAADVEWWIMSYLSVLSVITVVALCVAAAMMLPRGRRALAPLLVIPVLLMKPSSPDGLTPAGVQRLFQTIPERSLLPVLLGVVLLLAASRMQARSRWIWVGVISCLAALHNIESGVPATVAAALLLVALRAGWRALGYFAAAWIGVVVVYAGVLALAGGSLRPEYWAGFVLEFANGFAQLPMPPYGNYVFVLFVLVAGTASAFPVVWRGPAAMSVAATGGLYFGAWGLLMFPYYVGRSSSLGQLQFFLIPASVAAIWLLIGAARAVQVRRLTPRLAYAVLLCCLPAALCATTVMKAPWPETNLKRLTGGFSPDSDFRSTAHGPRPVVDEQQAQLIRDVSADARKPVGLFFTSGNVAALRTGLPNASVLAVPQELMARRPWSGDPNDTGNAAFRRMQCRSLQQSDLNSVIAEDLIADALDSCTGFTRGQLDRGMVVFTRTSG